MHQIKKKHQLHSVRNVIPICVWIAALAWIWLIGLLYNTKIHSSSPCLATTNVIFTSSVLAQTREKSDILYGIGYGLS